MTRLFEIEQEEDQEIFFTLLDEIFSRNLGEDVVLDVNQEGLEIVSEQGTANALQASLSPEIFSDLVSEDKSIRIEREKGKDILQGIEKWRTPEDTLTVSEDRRGIKLECDESGAEASLRSLPLDSGDAYSVPDVSIPHEIVEINPEELRLALDGLTPQLEGDRLRLIFGPDTLKFEFGEQDDIIQGNSPRISYDGSHEETITGTYLVSILTPIERFLKLPRLENVSMRIGDSDDPNFVVDLEYVKQNHVELLFAPAVDR